MANMSRTQSNRQEKIIISALVLLSVIAWMATVYYSHGMNSQMSMQMPGMEQQPSLIVEASLFLGMWIVMMVAMMFPAAAPMVIIFSNLHQNRKAKNKGFIPTWVFCYGVSPGLNILWRFSLFHRLDCWALCYELSQFA